VLISNEDIDIHDVGSGRRPLGHIFQWQGSEDSNDTSSKPSSCRNSVQGKALIADDKGIFQFIITMFLLLLINHFLRICMQQTKFNAKRLL
jgi:hypothetical protein